MLKIINIIIMINVEIIDGLFGAILTAFYKLYCTSIMV